MCKSCNVCPIPCLLTILPFISHSLSFYKEELAGENNNFVHDRATVTKKNISSVLSDMLDELVASVHRARSILRSQKAKDTWEEFIEGYVAFHFLTSRYKLEELLGPEFVVRLACQDDFINDL